MQLETRYRCRHTVDGNTPLHLMFVALTLQAVSLKVKDFRFLLELVILTLIRAKLISRVLKVIRFSLNATVLVCMAWVRMTVCAWIPAGTSMKCSYHYSCSATIIIHATTISEVCSYRIMHDIDNVCSLDIILDSFHMG